MLIDELRRRRILLPSTAVLEMIVHQARARADAPWSMVSVPACARRSRTARPTDPGFTFGQAENLLNVTSTMSHRIDLVQFRGPFTVEDAQVVGTSPADRTRLGLWPSDHAGVEATLTLSNGDDD
jgi:hypothetical protein